MKERLLSAANSKLGVTLLAIIVTIVYCTQISNVFDKKIDLNGDNVFYYTTAQALHNGQGFSTIFGLDNPSPHMHFPPGYPAFLSVLMDLGIDSVIELKVANCVLLLLSILLLFVITKRISGNAIFATLVCIVIACHAEILRWASMIMSEQLFLLLTTLAIFLLGSLEVEKLFTKGEWKSKIMLLSAAALLAYIYLVRSMGLSMAVAAIVWALCLMLNVLIKGLKTKNIDKKQLCRYAVVAVVLLVGVMTFKFAWDARNNRISPGFKSDYIGDFNKKPGGQTMDGIEDWTGRIVSNTKAYLSCYIPDALFEKNNEAPVENPGTLPLIGGLLLVVLISYGLLRLGKTGFLMFLYLAVTYAVLMVWPEQYAGLRYFITLIPLIILGFLGGLYGLVCDITRILCKKELSTLALVPSVIAAIIMIPRYVDAQEYYHQVAKIDSWTKVQNPSLRYFSLACEWAGKNLPENARMVSRKPELYYMLSGFRHCAGMIQYGTPEEVMKLLYDSDIEYILIDNMYIHAYRTYMPAVLKYSEHFALVGQWGQFNNETGETPTMILRFVK